MWRLSGLFIFLLASLSAQRLANAVVTGTVVDSQGKPAVGAMICTQWNLSGPAREISPMGPANTTDSMGTFALSDSDELVNGASG